MTDVSSEYVTSDFASQAVDSGYMASRSLANVREYGAYSGLETREKLIDIALERIAKGDTLTKICESPDMPGVSTLFRWMRADETIWSDYLRARETQAHVFASKVIDVAYDTPDPQRAKVQMDALKWAAARGAPKLFGDSTQLRHADADGNKIDNAPLVTELLALLPGGATQPAKPASQPAARLVRESRLDPPAAPAPSLNPAQSEARPAYRPRAPRDDCSDLV